MGSMIHKAPSHKKAFCVMELFLLLFSSEIDLCRFYQQNPS